MKKVFLLCVLCGFLLGTGVLMAQNSNAAPAAAEKTVQVDLEALNQMTPEQLQAYLAALEEGDLIEVVKIILGSNFAGLSTRVLEVLRQMVNGMEADAAKVFLDKLQAAIPELSISFDSAKGVVLGLIAPPSFVSKSVFSASPELSKAASIK